MARQNKGALQIKLRAFEKTDLDIVHRMFNNPELVRQLYSETVMPFSMDEEASFIESSVNPKSKENAYNFAIEKEDGALIGGCSYFSTSNKNRTCYVGISIYDPQLWGKGYGTAAMRKLLEFLFHERNMRKVLLNVFSFNKRAMASYKKLGFVEEGCLREQIYRDGKWHDEYVMALFAGDFRG
jgi:RimJ/RimL family protein N-acetyltransferase